MAIPPDTLSGANVGVDRFRVSDGVVLEALNKQNQSSVLRDALVDEIRRTENRVDRCLLGRNGDYFVVQLEGVLQMCSAITVSRIYRELGWGSVRYFGLPGHGNCLLLAKEGADVPINNLELIEKATRDGALLVIGS